MSENKPIDFYDFKNQILEDYKIILTSRECSNIARKEVLTGKAKFGIFGDGKELAQVVLAKFFKKGDFRSGYYRDQTLMFALKHTTVKEYFAQLYADTNIIHEPSSSGRQMNCHFATRLLDENGNWKSQINQPNTFADISPTAGQMPRSVGLAQASKIYRESPELAKGIFSDNGNEICYVTIGDASTSEGHFFETINAMCTIQVPAIVSIWDDGYGISVPSEYQRSKQDISEVLKGFQRTEKEKGCEIIKVRGWEYTELINAYSKAENIARNQHIPVIVHVVELTQPQGHSTSGSHERYKSEQRLKFEKDYDCLEKFKQWILNYSFINSNGKNIKITTEQELDQIETEIKLEIKRILSESWNEYQEPIHDLKDTALFHFNELLKINQNNEIIIKEIECLKNKKVLFKKDIFNSIKQVIRELRHNQSSKKQELIKFLNHINLIEQDNYSSHLYSDSDYSITKIPKIDALYDDLESKVDGRIIIRDNFDALFSKHKELLVFGEDVGKIGDVNQGLEGLQQKFGENRIFDTGIREATIVGQAIGLASRGLRPIAEIQYFDYILYALQILSDDVATLQYRTKGGQKSPIIIRTRGHRLEGIWHAGSHLGGIIHFLRGFLILVPRDFIRAAGFYNSLMHCDSPAIIIESLNGYRLKEAKPTNLGEFTIPIGEVEITKSGSDLTVLTYGSTWKIVDQAAKELKKLDIDIEIIDAQCLLPFDTSMQTKESLKKTNRLVVIDEDVPGGASAYLLQQVLDKQDAFKYLDSKPITITAKEHRCAYSTDGDYFSKPSVDDVIDNIYELMHEVNPNKYPKYL